MKKFELIKEFPLSPRMGAQVVFRTEQDFNDGIPDVGAIPKLFIQDCTNYPEFWKEIYTEAYYTVRETADEQNNVGTFKRINGEFDRELLKKAIESHLDETIEIISIEDYPVSQVSIVIRRAEEQGTEEFTAEQTWLYF